MINIGLNSKYQSEGYLYKHEGEKYSLGIPVKKQDGTWERFFIPIRFKTEAMTFLRNVPDKSKIAIESAVLQGYKGNDGKAYYYIFCFEFVQIDMEVQEKTAPKATKTTQKPIPKEVAEFKILTEEDLPF